MGAIENIDELNPLLLDCLRQTKRIWDLKENQDDISLINSRVNVFRDYMKKMEDVAGDVIEFCKELIEISPQISYEHYVNEDDDILESINRGHGGFKLWHTCSDLLIRNAYELKKYEREEREGRCEYILKENETEVWRFFEKSNMIQYVCYYTDTNNIPYKYCIHKKSFEYKLLSRLYDYLNAKLGDSFIVKKERLILFARVLCLYIAMRNEERQLIKDGTYLGMKFEGPNYEVTKASTKLKKTKQPREVFTERAKLYFAKVIEMEYMQEVDEEEGSGRKYEWTYYGGTVALVYFLIRVYEPESPPYKQLAPLFGLKDLTTHRSNLVNTDWYHDELIRVGKLPEEKDRNGRPRKLKNPPDWLWDLKVLFG